MSFCVAKVDFSQQQFVFLPSNVLLLLEDDYKEYTLFLLLGCKAALLPIIKHEIFRFG